MNKLKYLIPVFVLLSACVGNHYVPLRTYKPCHNLDQCAHSIANAISDNWSRPKGSRNNMSAVIEIEILQTGEMQSVRIVSSSGYNKFDEYAIKAVKKAAPFVEIQGLDEMTYRKYFTSFKLNFQPQDLKN